MFFLTRNILDTFFAFAKCYFKEKVSRYFVIIVLSSSLKLSFVFDCLWFQFSIWLSLSYKWLTLSFTHLWKHLLICLVSPKAVGAFSRLYPIGGEPTRYKAAAGITKGFLKASCAKADKRVSESCCKKICIKNRQPQLLLETHMATRRFWKSFCYNWDFP